MIGRSAGVGRPHSSSLPAGLRIIDASIQALSMKTHRVGDAKRYELFVDERLERIGKIPGGERHVFAQPESVVLIYPAIVARLGTAVIRHALELWSGHWI